MLSFLCGIVRTIQWSGDCQDPATIEFVDVMDCGAAGPLPAVGLQSVRRFLLKYRFDGRCCAAVARGGCSVGQWLYEQGLGGDGKKRLPEVLDERGLMVDPTHLVDELSKDVVYVVRARPGDAMTPLCRAASMDDLVALRRCSGRALDPALPGDFGPLHCAAMCGVAETLSLLVKRGASLEAAGPGGFTPLHCAARAGRVDMVMVLLRSGARADAFAWGRTTPLMCAVDAGHLSVVRALVGWGANVNALSDEGRSALMVAARAGHLAVVDLLLRSGARVAEQDCDGATPVMLALQAEQARCVERLLGRGSVTLDSSSLLRVAVARNQQEMVRLLLEQGACVDGRSIFGETALLLAAKWCRMNMLRLLLDAGADPNISDGTGATPVWLAAAAGWVEGIRFLAARGGDVNHANLVGVSAMAMALRLNCNDAALELMDWGAL